MYLSSRTRDIAILTVLFGVAAILLVIALVLWHRDGDGGARASTLEPLDVPTAGLMPQPQVTLPTKREQEALKDSLDGSLTVSSGTGAKHRVTLEATSGGDVYIGFLYRDGKGAGVFVKHRAFEVTRVVRGEAPAAVIAVQVLNSATATCSIHIDGKQVISKTARGPGDKVTCVA